MELQWLWKVLNLYIYERLDCDIYIEQHEIAMTLSGYENVIDICDERWITMIIESVEWCTCWICDEMMIDIYIYIYAEICRLLG